MAIAETALFQTDEAETLRRLKALMAPVEFKVAITGTSPGVGVSTFTMNLALALRHISLEGSDLELKREFRIGILDLGGSSFPQRFGANPQTLEKTGSRYLPARGIEDLRVVSLDMFRTATLHDRTTMQSSLAQVDWQELDLLLMELPSGIVTAEDLSGVLPPIDAAVIVSRPGDGEKERIRNIWKGFDAGTIPTVGLVSNMEGRFRSDDAEELGRTFGIPIRAAIPYEPALGSTKKDSAPFILAQKKSQLSRTFFHLSEDLVDYLIWLHDEHEQEEDF